MTWLYKSEELKDEDIPDKAFGFIYLITERTTGKRYIGRKLLTSAARRTVKGKVKKYRKESDWRDYWSSSPFLIEHIESEGTVNFTREILMFTPNRSQLNYLEEKFLYMVGALESEEWFNSNIRSKMYKRNILDKLDLETMNNALKRCTRRTKHDKDSI